MQISFNKRSLRSTLGSPNVVTQTESDDNPGDNAPVLVENI